MTAPARPAQRGTASDSFWVSLRYFNYYRIATAGVFLAVAVIYHDALTLGSHDLRLFIWASGIYLALGIGYQVLMTRWRAWFDVQLSFHVATDVVLVTLLMYSSGGMRSGLAVMLLVSLAAAALVSRGILMLFYAALATIAMLLEQTYWVLVWDHSTAGYLQPGLLSIGYFATALITNQLAQRVIINERVARQRGVDLANQLRINQLVMRDVQDGVLVVDANGLVHQFNPPVGELLGRQPLELDQVDGYSADLATRLAQWRQGQGGPSMTLRFPDSGKLARVRFVDAGLEGGAFTLVFLEDLSHVQEQARQLKLAALGRLTANIAHEIRNPLSAITHAADLLREEGAERSADRLCQIIRDNAQRLDRMVKDVMELSRRDRIQPETIQLGPFLSAFTGEFARNEQIDPACFVVEGALDAAVDFDRVHLHQVLWNLVRNAWRHGNKRRESVRISLSRRANRLELHVVDDGLGVAPELQAQLFEPFFTTFSSGTGLGLYIARELCAANGATLDYVDRRGGADFRILWQLT